MMTTDVYFINVKISWGLPLFILFSLNFLSNIASISVLTVFLEVLNAMGERGATLINLNSPFKGSCDGKDCWRCCDLCHQLCLRTSLSNFSGKFVLLQGWLLVIRCRLIDFFKKVARNEISGKICNFWPSINLSFDRMSCFKNWAWSAQPFWRVLDTKRQTNQSNSNVDMGRCL